MFPYTGQRGQFLAAVRQGQGVCMYLCVCGCVRACLRVGAYIITLLSDDTMDNSRRSVYMCESVGE